MAGKLGHYIKFWGSPVSSEAKAPIIRRIGDYFLNIANDYKIVALETLEDARRRPVKSFFIVGALSTFGYFVSKNPTEVDYKQRLLEHSNDILLVGEPIRNPGSDSHMRRMRDAINRGTLRRLSLGVCSVMWIDDHSRGVDTFEARCKQTAVSWRHLAERTVDVGALGRWFWLDRAMQDYDINPAEWWSENSSQ